MRAITLCPVCQTQFFVTEDQLNKHGGKVRCGQCLHVFNAKSQFISSDLPQQVPAEALPALPLLQENEVFDITPPSQPSPSLSQNTPSASPQSASPDTTEWPTIDDDDLLAIDNAFNHVTLNPSAQFSHTFNQELEAELVELCVSSDEIESYAAEAAEVGTAYSKRNKPSDVDDSILIEDSDFDEFVDVAYEQGGESAAALNEITELTSIADNQANYFNDLAKLAQRSTKKSHRWLWLIGVITLLLIAFVQSLYFWRNEIATRYPNIKPYLVDACQQLGCSVSLPKQIEFIVIDDSDMQEDSTHVGLVHFSSTLVNKANFFQAFPNLELTLTNTDDKPVLRKVFKPNEYLAAGVNISNGFKANEEVKINLAITTQGISVSGYRVFVSY